MNGTTFPNPGGEFGGGQPSSEQRSEERNSNFDYMSQAGGQSQQSYGGYNNGGNGGGNGGSYNGGNNGNYNNGGGYQKKPWQNNGGSNGNGGGYQKKPWNGERKPFQRPVETDMSFYKPYAVFGNKDVPPEILAKMIASVQSLEKLDYTMRCGGMDGLEDAIEKAVTGKKEVHLPFKDFNQKQSKFTYVSDRAKAVAKMFYPNWDVMKPGVQLFLAKNARVLMGQRVESPALFILCWTEDGAESKRDITNRTGFTGHPIAMASALGIPIFNFGNPSAENRLSLYLESLQQ